MGVRSGGSSSSVRSLPPPSPKSPPEFPDLYGKRRETAKIQMLEREISFLEEELKSVDGLQPASRYCKEVTDSVMAKSDPLIPTSRKNRKSCQFWKWLCGFPCFNLSWICCCCYSGCSGHLKCPICCDCDLCNCSPCICSLCKCGSLDCCSCNCSSLCDWNSCKCSSLCDCSSNKCSSLCDCCSCSSRCMILKWGCFSCPKSCRGRNCCVFRFPSCTDCFCCRWKFCPKCPKVTLCCNCPKTCCNPCCILF